MRKTYPFLLLVFATWMNCIPCGAQSFNFVQNNHQAAFRISNLPNLNPANPPLGPYTYWQMFWLYGDGNYHYRQGEMTQFGSSTPAYPTFFEYYAESGMAYYPMAFLIDRKTDNPPPATLGIYYPNVPITSPVNLDVPNGSPDDIFIDYPSTSPPILSNLAAGLTSPERVSIRHSHFIEAGNLSAFILPFYPEQEGRLYFFIPEGFAYISTHKPNYVRSQQTSAPLDTLVPITNLSGFPAKVQTEYNSALVMDFPLDNADQEILSRNTGQNPLFQELRLFHFLYSEDLDRDSSYNFLAIWASNDPEEPVEGLVDANYTEDTFVQPYIGPADDYSFMGRHYIDADTLQLKAGEPKDPNRLWAEEGYICSNNADNEIIFHLRFCNVAPYPTDSASIFIRVNPLHSDHIGCFEYLPLADNDDMTSIDVIDPCNPEDPRCAPLGFCKNDPYQVNVAYDPIFKDRTTQGFEHCRIFRFRAVADGRGLAAIQKGEGILASVNFHETSCELVTSWNDTSSIDPAPQPLVDCSDCSLSPCEGFWCWLEWLLEYLRGHPWRGLVTIVGIGALAFLIRRRMVSQKGVES